ncbi:MAG: type I-C CRISPR-associated protein Cas8c/Csd1 [Christensenellaceae bacterium]|jgi:CRISPR-associated protein Csd1|nr:type I-C CRISPR-associated protein Cas8c/Csd1 [Christensenellaceae bacterium]
MLTNEAKRNEDIRPQGGILNALCDAYDRIAKDEDAEIARDGFVFEKISYFVVINNDGGLKEIIDNTTCDKKEKLPENAKKNGVEGWFLYDTIAYALGLEWDKENKCYKEAIGGKDKKKFEVFKTKNEFLKDIEGNVIASSLWNFISKWEPGDNVFNELLKLGVDNKTKDKIYKELKGLFAFCIEDVTGKTWVNETILNSISKSLEEEMKGQCAVSGQRDTVIARNHKTINLGFGAGSYLVSSGDSAQQSYNKSASYNASVSETVMKKYAAALNYFLRKDSRNKTQFGKDTCVFWAECDGENYLDEVWDLLGITKAESDEAEVESKVLSTLRQIKAGEKPDEFETDSNTRFHILILSPNAARISVRRYYKTTFGKFKDNVLQHYKDMMLLDSNGKFKQIPIWQILDSTVSSVITKKRGDNVNPSFAGALSESIVNCYPYPNGMYAEILMRVKTDVSASDYLTNKRISFIKAYIVRKDRKNNTKEEIKVELHKGSDSVAYGIGRIFAILEMAQQDAIGKDMNTTIKDRYFASACGTPAAVFPILLVGYQNHLSKLGNDEKKKWLAIRYEKLLQEIFPKVGESFPKQLDLDGQGRFIIGYYQQKTALWTKQENKEEK